MPAITALLQTSNDALRLGRTLQTLLPCDEIVVVDQGSHDGTARIAREYGARIVPWDRLAPVQHYLRLSRYDWILCLEPRESLTEALEASLFEWKSLPSENAGVLGFSIFLREESAQGWFSHPIPQVRLIQRGWNQWQGLLPANSATAPVLEGELLRFSLP